MLDPRLKEEFDENIFTLSKGPNQESLETFLDIAHRCVAETQAPRPDIETVVDQLKTALLFQAEENSRDIEVETLGNLKQLVNKYDEK
ncbi:hypothetical protein L2E82_27987 [Cichorium intybus]|uniref:Uncharacterized protein n=1 Tax=Cichorium intybus TaxID=13427 RepID=A0ACB9CUG0_CICIN|nr:hypothetical protein L2E82_27987 [Cichorium intybus]